MRIFKFLLGLFSTVDKRTPQEWQRSWDEAKEFGEKSISKMIGNK